ncbi:MAG: efflux RND transporter periplasmic adaptor subunit [Oscillatoriales cyanobacterium RM2_1_1]|nr:efflux RND transporter periplasmic adaptor subunit [Oscillatoriales cyanobacterium SM2_3_0]NJO44242.1 efflux RND transporter periplasmic adaptor subunit [Oscillatoriales cyanobacterium RM2_1_1]
MVNSSINFRQLVFPFLGALMLASCASQPQAAGPPPAQVTIKQIEPTSVKDSTTYNARVEGAENAVIRPRVDGAIKQVYVDLGDRVEVGEPLLLIDPAQQQANLASQLATVESRRAEVVGARADLAAAEAELKRVQAELEFQSQGANLEQSQQEVEVQKQERERLQFELEDAQKSLNAANRELDRRQAIQTERQASFDRYNELYKEGVVSREIYDERLRDLETSQADVANQQEEIRAAQSRVEGAKRGIARQAQTIKGAQAGVSSANSDLERQITTLEAQIESRRQNVQSQQARIELLQRQIQSAQAQAVAQQVELEYYNVTAPIAGIVGDIPVKVGNFVNSQTELTSIRSNDQLEINIEIPVARLSQIQIGTPVEVISQETGEVIGTSRVSFISPSAGTGTQTILVKAIYDNNGGSLRTDQIVRARVIWDQQSGLTVPTTAVSRIGGQSFVFVVEEENQEGQRVLVAKQRPVELGSVQGQDFEVLSGMKAGDRVVTDGVVKLQNGSVITDQAQQPPAGETPPES